MLRERGITHVRPLAGGFNAWRQHAYPVETRLYPEETSASVSQK